MREIIAGKNDASLRLDKFLTKLMPKLPKGMLYKGLRKNCVRINGKHIKDGAFMLTEGDKLSLYFSDGFFEKPSYASDFIKISEAPDIVYEDLNILLINKPQGVLVHEDNRQNPDNLLSRIKSYLYKKGEYLPDSENTFAPALANRIDRGTGGLVIAAKNAEALRILNEKLKNREIKKKYLCLAYGHFKEKEGTLSGSITRDENTRMSVFSDDLKEGAKSALTKYCVLEEFPDYSLLEITLETGRTHQIRASLAYFGHPILGDRKYAPKELINRFSYSSQALLAYKLSFELTGNAGILEYLKGKTIEVRDINFK